MSNTFTGPNFVKALPHASGERQVGDADPQARPDVINRVPKGYYAILRRLFNTLFDGLTVDFTDASTVTAFAASLIQQVVLTNKTGGSLVAGDVVALDAGNDSAVALGDTAASLKRYVVALESISSNVVGRFAAPGSVVSVKVTATVVRGNYLLKSATTKVLVDSGTAMGNTQTLPEGTVALALTADSGGFCTALLFGQHGGLGLDTTAVWTKNHEWSETNGQKLGLKKLTELTTIGTGATTSTAIQIPAGAVALAVSVRCTVSIPGTATMTIGDGVTAAKFNTGASIASSAGTTDPGTKAGPTYYAAATAIVITPNATPSTNAGRVRVTIFYYDSTPPTS